MTNLNFKYMSDILTVKSEDSVEGPSASALIDEPALLFAILIFI